MPWKTEIDRLVHHVVLDAGAGEDQESVQRAVRTVADLAVLAPGRDANHFHAGALEEIVGATRPEDAAAWLEGLPAADGDAANRWRHLGQLDAASRGGDRARIRALMDDPAFESGLEHPEGRIALRAVGRMLLRDGEGDRAFDLYRRHLTHVNDEGSRRDAEFLLEESLRRADRDDQPLEATLARLERASEFARECGLDARAQSKIDRKAGRIHQLEGNWDEAVARYERALERLPAEDPYRSVLVGDLALATLGVRGTLDLLPTPDREGRARARALLESGQGGEGRSYNAIYTLGMLSYEEGDWDTAARHLEEADALMRENRAKARIVHARSRFFLGRCLLEKGAEGDELDHASRLVLRNAGAVSLEPEVKGPVFDALVLRVPDVRIPGRPTARATAPSAGRAGAGHHLDLARQRLQEGDAHAALDLVDRAFKSRPDFDTWFGAYRTRLEALLALGEAGEALRTYERFRAKLCQRGSIETLEAFLGESDGPVSRLLDATARDEQLFDLLQTAPERREVWKEAGRRAAQAHLESGDAARIRRGLAMLTELAALEPDVFADAMAEARGRAEAAGALEPDVDKEETKSLLEEEEDPVRLLVVGSDAENPKDRAAFESLARAYRFEGCWIATGVRPPYKTLREIAGQAEEADVVLVHHAVGPELCEEVRRIGEKHDVPVRQAAWLGPANLEYEVLQTLKDAFVD